MTGLTVRGTWNLRAAHPVDAAYLHHALISSCDSLPAALFVTLWPKGVKGAFVLVAVVVLGACVAFPFICFTFTTQSVPVQLSLLGRPAEKAQSKRK